MSDPSCNPQWRSRCGQLESGALKYIDICSENETKILKLPLTTAVADA